MIEEHSPYGSEEQACRFVHDGLGFSPHGLHEGRFTLTNSRTGETIDGVSPQYWGTFVLGYVRGRDIASHQDLPEVGSDARDLSPECHGVIDDIDDAEEVFLTVAHQAEENNRQFSPFEHIAAAINSREDFEEAWRAYDEGIARGIHAEWHAVKKYIHFDEEE